MSDINDISNEMETDRLKKIEKNSSELIQELTDISFETTDCSPDSQQAIVYYVAGYIARSISKTVKCSSCRLLLSPGNTITISFENDDIAKEEIDAKEEFLLLMSRGGLLKPSDVLYVTCVHASQLFHYMHKSKLLISLDNSRSIFCKIFKTKLSEKEHTSCILDHCCKDSHKFGNFIEKISVKMFNILSKNIISEINDGIHAQRKRPKKPKKRDQTSMKVRKLTSD